jgi:hypothetical protein
VYSHLPPEANIKSLLKRVSDTTLALWITNRQNLDPPFGAYCASLCRIFEPKLSLFYSSSTGSLEGVTMLILFLARRWAPWILNLFPNERAKVVKKMFETVSQEGMKIVQGRKREVEESMLAEKQGKVGVDILSLCSKSVIYYLITDYI